LINNRQQSGRRRGRGGQRQNNNGGGNGRLDNGNRIDNRARGNAAQMLEKYKSLARDAQQAGDRVLTEVYLQYADHYFRVLSETRARYEENNPQARRQQGDFPEGANSFEGEEGDEGDDGDDVEEFRQPQQRQQPRQDRPREDRPREDRPQQQRDERPRRDYGEDRPQREERPQQREERPQQRDDRPQREDRPQQQREERPRRDYSEQRAPVAAQPREREERAERPRRPLRANGNGSANDAHDDDARLDMSVLPPAIAPVERAAAPVAEDEAPTPKRRGRPRKIVEDAPAAE